MISKDISAEGQELLRVINESSDVIALLTTLATIFVESQIFFKFKV